MNVYFIKNVKHFKVRIGNKDFLSFNVILTTLEVTFELKVFTRASVS